MSRISAPRRFALAGVSLLLAAFLFHAQVASAVVTRGDDAARNGDRGAAMRYYYRALWIDAGSEPAADRLAFALAARHRPRDAQAAVVIATAALTQTPGDAALLADRGLAEQRLGRWRAAEDDFAQAGRLGRDARYDHLAARIALRLGDVPRARTLLASALASNPAFAPARVALARLPR